VFSIAYPLLIVCLGAPATQETQPSPSAVLGNNHVRIELGGETGMLRALANRKTQASLTVAGPARPLVGLVVKTPGKDDARSLDQAQAACPGVRQPDENTLVIPLSFLEGLLRVECRITLGTGGLTTWTCRVVNNSPVDVIAVKFPILVGVRIGPSAADDELVLPRHGGVRLPHPASGGRQAAKYLGSASMPWMDLYDARGGGVYLAALDEKLSNLELSATPVGGGGAVTLALEKFDSVPRDGERTWTYQVGVHAGDWHWGADRYREWFRQHHPAPEHPGWLSDCDGLYRFDMSRAQGWRFAQLSTRLWYARAVGLDTIQCRSQSGWWRGGGRWSFPGLSPAMGTVEDLTAAIGRIHISQGRIGFTLLPDRVNAYNVVTGQIDGLVGKDAYPEDTLMPGEKLFVEGHLVESPDGQVTAWPVDESAYEEFLRPWNRRRQRQQGLPMRRWQPMRSWSPQWQQYVHEWAVDSYLKRFKADTVLLDGIASEPPRESFDSRIGEHGVGRWGWGHAQLVARIHKAVATQPHRPTLGTAGCGDAFGAYAFGRITGLDEAVEVYRYTLPEHVVFGGGNGRGEMAASLSRAHLCGNRFEVDGPYPLAARLIALRAATRAWIYPARFMDTVGLVAPETIQARWFLTHTSTDRAAAVTLVNPTGRDDVEVMLDVSRVGPIARALALDAEGGIVPLPLQQQWGMVRFKAPASRHSVVLLINRCGPNRGCVCRIDYDTTGGPRPRMRVRFGRLGETSKVRLTIKGNAGLQCEHSYAEFQAAAGSVHEHTSPVEPTLGFNRPLRMSVQLDSGADSGKIDASTYAVPWMVDPSFERAPDDADPKRFLHAIDNTVRAADGKQSLRLNPHARFDVETSRPLFLVSGRRYRITVMRQWRHQHGFRVGASVVELAGDRTIGTPKPMKSAAPRDENAWQPLAVEFTASPEADGWRLIFFNGSRGAPVWFDDVVIREIEP